MIVGDEGRQWVVQVDIWKSMCAIKTLDDFMKIPMQEGIGELTPVSGVMSGTYSPYQGPPQGPGGYPAPPNPGARYLIFFHTAVLDMFWHIHEKVQHRNIAGSPPTPLDNREVPVLLRTLGKGLLMQVIDATNKYDIIASANILVQHESQFSPEPGGGPQQYQMHPGMHQQPQQQQTVYTYHVPQVLPRVCTICTVHHFCNKIAVFALFCDRLHSSRDCNLCSGYNPGSTGT